MNRLTDDILIPIAIANIKTFEKQKWKRFYFLYIVHINNL